MLSELIIFAVVLVTLNAVVGISVTCLAFRLFTNKKFLKGYLKKMLTVVSEIQEEELDL